MLTIVMRDKTLSCSQTAPIYQYDNNVDQIKCLLPCTYEGICLKNATVLLAYRDENGNGDYIELYNSDEMYTAEYHQFINRINSKITSYVGKISLWLKIYDNEDDYSFETGETSFTVLPNKSMQQNNNQKQLSYLDQCLMKITQMQNTALKTLRECTNQTNIARAEAENTRLLYEKINNGGGQNG